MNAPRCACLCLLALLLSPARTPAVGAAVQARCEGFTEAQVSAADLRCMQLYPTAAGGEAHGVVELIRVASPFGLAVTPEGRQRYELELTLAGLPAPETLGGEAFVAWAAAPNLQPVLRLGEVTNGRTRLGEVSLNKFLVLVSSEPDVESAERRGPLLLRGSSPSSRMHPEDLITRSPMALMPPVSGEGHAHAGAPDGDAAGQVWLMPPMHPAVTPVPGLMALRPDVAPFLPSVPDLDAVPLARQRQVVSLPDGGTLDLEAGPVRRRLGGHTLLMYGFNGQYPGPLLRVPERATIFVNFRNRTELPLTIHWHGVRLDNRFDGVPGLTQDVVPPGGSFRYQVYFRDAGIYWYHPHHREDIAQDLGLYGNMLVRPAAADAYDPVHREEALLLDDLLLGEEGLVAYGREAANFALMGRFGNVFLVNGETDWSAEVRRGEVVRFFFTNVSNTRTFNLTWRHAERGAPLRAKLIGTDVGRFERQQWVSNVVIAPAERYVVEVRFEQAGEYVLRNEVQAVNHRSGTFRPEVSDLARVSVSESPAEPIPASFETLRTHADVVADVDRYRQHFERAPDHELQLQLHVQSLPLLTDQLMSQDAVYFNPAEWAGTMPMMNWAISTLQVQWRLVDPATGKVDEAIDDWRFRVGDVVKIRIHNLRDSFHAMQHPIHFHGQRFLVLSQDAVANQNLAWKDTFLAPTGSVTDLLLELSNPGRWMVHCHIAEHLESGMKMVFTVEE